MISVAVSEPLTSEKESINMAAAEAILVAKQALAQRISDGKSLSGVSELFVCTKKQRVFAGVMIPESLLPLNKSVSYVTTTDERRKPEPANLASDAAEDVRSSPAMPQKTQERAQPIQLSIPASIRSHPTPTPEAVQSEEIMQMTPVEEMADQ
ncbi:hypothetical protein ANRL3_02825 [Anaerolineae bacterium]|nr:hypothetical protein ANRL3_02825 [Anaerolineae bacterium]